MSGAGSDVDFEELVRVRRERIAADHREVLASLPDEPLRWLVIPPGWSIELATAAGFPAPGDIRAFFHQAVEKGFVTRSEALVDTRFSSAPPTGDLESPPQGRQTLFCAPPGKQREVIDAKRSGDLSEEIARIGKAVLRASAAGAALFPGIQGWASLAAYANADPSGFLLQAVDAALDRLDFADAARWIEAAMPIERLVPGRFSEAMYLANVRYLLRQQQRDAAQSLEHFVLREPLMAAFRQLLEGPPNQWALHYAGAGGVGKTMLMRHLQSREIPNLGGSVARVDFDYLNPEYPSTKPALLLVQLAEELRLHDKTGIASSYFESFSRKAVTFHEGLTASVRPASPVELIRDPEFQNLLRTFSDAVLELPQPVVLILDTCEELSKMHLDGSVPDNVTATFEVLEGLHALMPSLRVVFAGRRPLASRGAGGWKAKFSPAAGLARDYLRVHEVRGFERASAISFLREGAKCPTNLLDAVLERCPERAHVPQFDWTPQAGSSGSEHVVERFSPYELALYASWIAADPQLDVQSIRTASFDQYVKTRVISRLRGPYIVQLLPALAWLGRFDDQTLLALSGKPDRSADARALVNEFLRQEWVERLPGGYSEIERSLQPLLLDYFRVHHPAALEAARAACANHLEGRFASRALPQLDLSDFEALLRLLQPEPLRAARWWHKVEAAVLKNDAYGFILPITRRLLSDDFMEGSANATDQRITASIACTHAAALLHVSSPLSEEWVDIWKQILRESTRHPDPEAGKKLRALASAADGLYGPLIEIALTEETAAALLTFIERAISPVGDSPDSMRDDPASRYRSAAHACNAIARSATLSAEVQAFALLLAGRAHDRLDHQAKAMACWHAALMKTEAFGRVDPQWLHWVCPDDPSARLRLEFVSRMYPAVLGPMQLSWLLPLIESPRNVDADRLGSAVLSMYAAQGPLGTKLPDTGIKLAERFQSTASIHARYPPYFVSIAEERAREGDVEHALEMLKQVHRDSETEALSYEGVVESDRASARIQRRYRLLEVGHSVPDGLESSDELKDIHLRAVLRALSFSEDLRDKGLHGEGTGSAWNAGLLSAEAAHFAWSVSGGDFVPGEARTLFDTMAGWAEPETFIGLLCRLDLLEIAEKGGLVPDSSMRRKSSRVPIEAWWQANAEAPEEALTLWLRKMALQGAGAPPRRLIDRVGIRRSGMLALEEGELLAIRLPSRAQRLFTFASEQFKNCEDCVSAFIAESCLAIGYARRQEHQRLTQALQRVRSLIMNLPFTVSDPSGTEDFPRQNNHTWGDIEALAQGRMDSVSIPQPGWSDAMHPWLLRIATCLACALDKSNSTGHRIRMATIWKARTRQLPPDVRDMLATINWTSDKPIAVANVKAGHAELVSDKWAAANPPEKLIWQTGPFETIRIHSERFRSRGSLLERTSMIIKREGHETLEIASPPATLPYDRLAMTFHAESAMGATAFDVDSSRGSVRLEVDRNAAWLCWEAALWNGTPPRVVRSVMHPGRNSRISGPSPSGMYSLVGSSREAALADGGRAGLNWDYSTDPEELGSRPSLRESGQILHIIGEPVETSAGLRMQLSRDGEVAGAMSVTTGTERGRLVSADEAGRLLPDIRMAILQCPIQLRSARTGSDRERAAYLRSFAAELHARIPLIVTVPSLEFDVGIQVLSCLTHADLNSRFDTDVIADRVETAQLVLRRAQYSEESLDICFYGD